MMSPGKGRHAAVGMRIGWALLDFVETNHLGAVFDSSAGYILSRRPDTLTEPELLPGFTLTVRAIFPTA